MQKKIGYHCILCNESGDVFYLNYDWDKIKRCRFKENIYSVGFGPYCNKQATSVLLIIKTKRKKRPFIYLEAFFLFLLLFFFFLFL